jgi:hypothetical protein
MSFELHGEAGTQIKPYGFRWVAFDEQHNRMQLQGDFTVEDLLALAGWLKNPNHPCIGGLPVIDVKLSKISVDDTDS